MLVTNVGAAILSMIAFFAVNYLAAKHNAPQINLIGIAVIVVAWVVRLSKKAQLDEDQKKEKEPEKSKEESVMPYDPLTGEYRPSGINPFYGGYGGPITPYNQQPKDPLTALCEVSPELGYKAVREAAMAKMHMQTVQDMKEVAIEAVRSTDGDVEVETTDRQVEQKPGLFGMKTVWAREKTTKVRIKR